VVRVITGSIALVFSGAAPSQLVCSEPPEFFAVYGIDRIERLLTDNA